MTKRSLAFSFMLHSLLLLAIVAGGSGQGNGKHNGDQEEGEGSGQDKNGNFLDKAKDGEPEEPKEIQVTLINIPKRKPEDKTEGVKDCKGDQWYGGVGIRNGYPAYDILEIAKGYAADKAGLQLHDMIVEVDGQPTTNDAINHIRGEPGTQLELTIYRDGQLIHFSLTREKICVDEGT